ncbi:MAG: DUF1566 domain-containing protein [Desulfotignum sp.]|jgi:hypothetical protein|nr:DUF1566 domain-containing protein [Desulfotignum sp.]
MGKKTQPREKESDMKNRFSTDNDVVIDAYTGLMWTRNAGLVEFPMTWEEALDQVDTCNASGLFGYQDWKLPNRRELFSLMSHEMINPSLPEGHPFTNVFTGYYWTASSCARLPDQAWYVHLGGARVFKGMKYGSYMVWPVRVADKRGTAVLQTGQKTCFDAGGSVMDCHGSGQDGDFQAGVLHKENRFTSEGACVHDSSTGLTWVKNAHMTRKPLDWKSASDMVSQMNRETFYGFNDWRVPGIGELESLTDLENHSPALALDHGFADVQPFYWSATTSMYDTAYAWVLYTKDGAVGVGYKPLPEFFLWPVRTPPRQGEKE